MKIRNSFIFAWRRVIKRKNQEGRDKNGMREDEDVTVINHLAERKVEKNISSLDWM